MTTALSVLQQTFGYPSFRGQQADIIEHVAGGGDALVLMPTSGGKSLCYQIPALLRRRTTVVVSPLIALMEDQVTALGHTKVRAAYLNSTVSGHKAVAIGRNLVQGVYDLLYVAPERLLTSRFLELLAQAAALDKIGLFAIDEAHCVSEWGHDFRPDYMRLSVLHESFPDVPRIALTATADEFTRADIVANLHLQDARVFVSSLDRPNIRYCIIKKRNVLDQLLGFIRKGHGGATGIVYCSSRRKVEEAADFLDRHGVRALPYHAGMSSEDRTRNQSLFLEKNDVVMVATTAFGMGIDKSNVRFVAHLALPRSVEGYYQETGRAGRDGHPADAWMAYGLADAVQQGRMIEDSVGQERCRRISMSKLSALVGLCEVPSCRRVALLSYFGEESSPCGNCDNCLNPPQTCDGTQAVQSVLACVSETGQRFGRRYLIDTLIGEVNDGNRALQHVGTFGVGGENPREYWHGIVRQMVALSLLRVDWLHGVLQLTPASRAVMTGQRGVSLRPVSANGAQKGRHAQRGASFPLRTHPLWDRLRNWREATASARHVPEYKVIEEITLLTLARYRPKTIAALRNVPGITGRQVQLYGESLVALLAVD